RIRVSDGRRSDTLPAFSLKVEPNAWSARKPMLVDLGGGHALSFNDTIYLFRDWYNPDHVVDRYDADSDSWTHVIRYPEDWRTPAVHLIGGKFYVITSGTSQDFMVRIYSPSQ